MAESPGATKKSYHPLASDLAGYNRHVREQFGGIPDSRDYAAFTLFPEDKTSGTRDTPHFLWGERSNLPPSPHPASDCCSHHLYSQPCSPSLEEYQSRGDNPLLSSPLPHSGVSPVYHSQSPLPGNICSSPGYNTQLSPSCLSGVSPSYNSQLSHPVNNSTLSRLDQPSVCPTYNNPYNDLNTFYSNECDILQQLGETITQGYENYPLAREDWTNIPPYSPLSSPEQLPYNSPPVEKDFGGKPSYSEVARSSRIKGFQCGKSESEGGNRKSGPVSTKSQKTLRKAYPKGYHQSKINNWSSATSPTPPVHPDSKYGLDQFEETAVVRKNSTSASLPETSVSENYDESGIHLARSVEDLTSSGDFFKSNNHKEKTKGFSSVKDSNNTSTNMADFTNSPNSEKTDKLSNNGVKTERTGTKEQPFFDPKRIFQSRSNCSASIKKTSPGSKNLTNEESFSTPVLNNGKLGFTSKAATTTAHKHSDYINNDLRDTKKKSSNHGRKSPDSYGKNSQPEEPSPCGHFYQKDKSQNECNRPTSKMKSSVNPQGNGESPLINNMNEENDTGRPSSSIDQETIDEWLSYCQEKAVLLCHHTWSIVVTLVLLLITLIAFVVSNLSLLVAKFCSKLWQLVKCKIFRKIWEDKSSGQSGDSKLKLGLDENIKLPSTGEEAMQRLLACKGKDPYSILGLHFEATDDEIKKYYKRQAVLVHPDKNQQPGAEEAFKILGHAFELIGEPDKRRHYDVQLHEATQAETAMQEFADLLTKLQEKIQEAANMMRCDNCGGKHKRLPVERAWYSARFCDRCNQHHSVKEGDVWAETKMLGFLWHYYACMEGKVFDITEWVACRKEFFKHMQANAHHVFYRIATEGNRNNQQGRSGENDLEDFINHLFQRAMGSEGGESPKWPAGQKPSTTSPPSSTTKDNARRRKKKKKH